MKRYFLIGICGISMSSLAIYLKGQGFFVRGYDRSNLSELEKHSVEVTHEKNTSDIDWADEVIYSSAFSQNDFLISYAKKIHKPCFQRGKLLGDIASKYENVIAVAGSHGKSTVTAMIYSILRVSGQNPTLHLGAIQKESGKSYDHAGSKYFVTEACEYHDNFLFLHPSISVVTNVEKEHLDFFHSFSNEKKSFQKFAKQSGICIKSLSYQSKNIRCDNFGRVIFDVEKNGQKCFSVHLSIGGTYNAQNALYAIEVCKLLGVSDCLIKLGLESFKGLQKRFERVNCKAKGNVFLDYAHHPSEIESVVKSIALIKGKKATVFQPHTFSRTLTLMDDFVNVLSKFDEVILFKTYAAREEEQPEVEQKLLSKLSQKTNAQICYCQAELEQKLLSLQSDVLVIMGAGDLPEKLLESGFIWRN